MKTSSTETQERSSSRTSIGRLVLFVVAVMFLQMAVGALLRIVGSDTSRSPFAAAMLYACSGVLLTSTMYPNVFTRAFWHVSWRLPIFLLVAAAVQLAIDCGTGTGAALTRDRAIIAIFAAPIVEEMARAAMFESIVMRAGTFWTGIIITLLSAGLHSNFVVALIPQAVLTAILIFTRSSLPSTVSAHLVMNVIAVGMAPHS